MDTSRAFISHARSLLLQSYLPRIGKCVRQLDDDALWWRANARSNSVGNLLLHLSGNVHQWIVSGVGGAPDVRERDREFELESDKPPGEVLLARLSETLIEADDALARLDPSRLSETCRIQGRDGVTVLEAVLHVVEHFSMHTGQIILLTKILSDHDLTFYDFTGGVPREKWREE